MCDCHLLPPPSFLLPTAKASATTARSDQASPAQDTMRNGNFTSYPTSSTRVVPAKDCTPLPRATQGQYASCSACIHVADSSSMMMTMSFNLKASGASFSSSSPTKLACSASSMTSMRTDYFIYRYTCTELLWSRTDWESSMQHDNCSPAQSTT